MYVTTTQSVFRSDDWGATWTDLRFAAWHFPKTMEVSQDGDVFISKEDSVYYTYDSGKSWNEFNRGLRGLTIQSFTITDSGYLFGAARNAGLFRAKLPASTSLLVSTETLENTSQALKLMPAYPNPFRGTSYIHFELPTRMHTTLAVYNLLGQRVSVLAAGTLDAGRHTVPFSASSLPSGVYFYELQAGSQRLTQQVAIRK